jgi:hypothetical protein
MRDGASIDLSGFDLVYPAPPLIHRVNLNMAASCEKGRRLYYIRNVRRFNLIKCCCDVVYL